MYMYTYIRNKNCHQYSYGFQNFMSSWGSWSKISKLKQVGDFSFFGSKSSLLVSKVSFNYVYTLTTACLWDPEGSYFWYFSALVILQMMKKMVLFVVFPTEKFSKMIYYLQLKTEFLTIIVFIRDCICASMNAFICIFLHECLLVCIGLHNINTYSLKAKS